MRHPARVFSLLSTLLLAAIAALGQWDVPVRIQLDGAQAEDRQVHGLVDPLSNDAAVSVDASRAGTMSYAQATGTILLVAELIPAPLSYSAGMVVTLIPLQANVPGVQVDLNGLGAQPIVKVGDLPLDSADLHPGVPFRLVHDGQRFRLLGSTALPCPAGYHVGGREFCIADSSRSELTFFDAVVVCNQEGARLCTYGEWLHACLSGPGFLGTVLDYEWVDDAANNANNAKRVGNGGDGLVGTPPGINCKHGGTTPPTSLHRYRCCAHR